MAEEKIVVEMGVEKECKKCVRFGAKGVRASETCTAIYVQNEALVKLENPKRIRVTIEAV